MVTIQDIQHICLEMPAVTQDIKWEDRLCFCVADKLFLITSPDQFPVSASFKTTGADFEALTQLEGFTQAPYLARNQWVAVDDIRRFNPAQWLEYIGKSYKLVAMKLTKKTKTALGISPESLVL